MFKLKKLAILSVVTVASIENSYSMEYMEELLGTSKTVGAISSTSTNTTLATDTIPTLPNSYDMRRIMGTISEANSIFPVYTQDSGNDCTANAAAGAMQYCQIRNAIKRGTAPGKVTTFAPSRRFIYWYARSNTGEDTSADTEATIGAFIYTIINNGVCPESLWPYSKSISEKPSKAAIAAAKKYVDLDTLAEAQITTTGTKLLTSIKSAVSKNIPIIIGVNIFASF